MAPVRLQIDASQRVQTLTVTNPAAAPLTVQLEAYSWTQPDGEDVLEPSRELVIAPPILQIPAGGSGRARIGLRRPSTPERERAFRIFVTEVLPENAVARAPVQFRTRMSLPLFVPPASPAPAQPTLQWRRAADTVEITNEGDRHIQISELVIRSGADDTALDLPQLGYLLPGSQRSWPLPKSLGDSASILISTRTGELRGPLSAGP